MAKQNTPGVGVEYEIVVPAYFALKLNNHEEVKDFTIRSNVAEEFGNMDDVVVDITMKDNTEKYFALQLKHKERKGKKILPTNFEAKGDFCLEKYCKAFHNIKPQNKRYNFILYTNKEINLATKEQSTKFKIIEEENCCGKAFFDTSSQQQSVYRFEAYNEPDYDEFFSKFTVYVGQKNYEDMEEEILNILKNTNALLSYTNLFRKWHQNRFTNKTINRKTVNIHLVDIFLAPFVINRVFSNVELFQKFDVTVIHGSKSNLIDHEEKIIETAERILYLGKEYKIIDRMTNQLDSETQEKILTYFFEKPLIVDFNEASRSSIFQSLKLYQKDGIQIRFVLVGPKIDVSELSSFRLFENLDDLAKVDETLYFDVAKKCKVSIQGRYPVTLEELIGSFDEIRKFVGVKEILEMLQGDFLIGEKKEILPPSYILRRVSAIAITTQAILNHIFVTTHFLIINFDNKFEQVGKMFDQNSINIVQIKDFFKLAELPHGPTIVATNEECSKELLDEVFQKINSPSMLHLKMIDIDTFILKTYKNFTYSEHFCRRLSVNEDKIYEYFNDKINIVCAQPGMGKSTLVKMLKNQCSSEFWTIRLDLKAHNMFLKTKREIEQVLQYILQTSENEFLERIKKVFLDKKKVVLFFDGLDELDNQCVDNVLDYTEQLSKLGFHVWISSRENLQEKLQTRFSKHVIGIEEVKEVEQKEYIKNRLCPFYEEDEVQQLTNRIFNSTEIVNNRQVLGIPLQLFIITQIFLDDKAHYHHMSTNIFVMSKMYKFFFEGRYRYTFDKQESKNPHLAITEPEDHLEKYEILALQSLFDDDVFEELNLDMRRTLRFLEKIKDKKDPLGVVVTVNNENKAVFEHFTYAEYFACVFLSNNFDKATILREQLFSDRYKDLLLILNVMLAEENPLHLAVIYKDFEQMEKHKDNGNTHDKGGRNPLHLAVCHGLRYPGCLTTDGSGWSFMTSTFLLMVDQNMDNRKTLKYAIKFDPFEYDQLFKWSSVDYAMATRCLVIIETILKNYGFFENVTKLLEGYQQEVPFAFFCALCGCPNLLSAVLDKNLITHMTQWLQSSLLHTTITYCFFQKLETLDVLIKRGIDVNTSFQGETPLHLATKKKYLDVVTFLLRNGATIGVTDTGDTLLHFAVQNKRKLAIEYCALTLGKSKNSEISVHPTTECRNIELVELFIKEGVSTNSKNSKGETPLHIAIESGDLEAIEFLYKNGGDINAVTNNQTHPIHYAASSGHVDVLDFVLNKTMDVDVKNDNGETPLFVAVSKNHLNIVNMFVKKGANLNTTNKEGLTLLHIAAEKGYYEMFESLLEKELKLDVTTVEGDTTLHSSVTGKETKIVELCINKGININATNQNNETPLHYASEIGKFDNIKLLLDKGARVDVISAKNETVLHCVSRSDCYEGAALFIERNIDVNVVNCEGDTALLLAIRNKNFDLVELIVRKCANVDDIKSLHETVKIRNFELITLLLFKGFDLNGALNGETALHVALREGDWQVAKFLLDKGAISDVFTYDHLHPLQLAVYSGCVEAVELLLEKTNLEKIERNHKTHPLLIAERNGLLQKDLLLKMTSFIGELEDKSSEKIRERLQDLQF